MTRLSQNAVRTEPSNNLTRLASWYMPALTEGLGDRLLLFDNSTASSLEMLRFKPEFCKIPQFEEALRQRVETLASFKHSSIAEIRSVELLGDDDGLALVSNHVIGRRLSEIQSAAQGPEFATELVAQLVPVLAALQEQGDGVAHGLLTAERVMVTSEGRLVLTEHVLGPALEALHLSPEQLREEFGLMVRPGSARIDDPRADVIQLGFLAVTLLVGQRLRSLDAAREVVSRLNSRTADSPCEAPAFLSQWLRRALDVEGTPFVSANDAERGLMDWPDRELPADPVRAEIEADLSEQTVPADVPPPGVSDPIVIGTFPARRSIPVRDAEEAVRPDHNASRSRLDPDRRPAAQVETELDSDLENIDEEFDALVSEARPADFAPPATARALAPLPVVAVPDERAATAIGEPAWRPIAEPTTPAARGPAAKRWLIPALAAGCIVQSVIIANLLISRGEAEPAGPAATAAVAATPPAGPTTPGPAAPAEPPPSAPRPASQAPSAGALTATTKLTPAPPVPPAPKPAPQGWLTIDSPLALQVYEGQRLVGSTNERVSLPPGRHSLRLVSASLEFETSANVEIAANRGLTTKVAVPNGMLSLNALPWAEVSLDGQALGTTPFANLSVPIGTHEVIWRHPQFGERRQTIVLGAKTPARLVVDLRK
jgi:hypothetical protein